LSFSFHLSQRLRIKKDKIIFGVSLLNPYLYIKSENNELTGFDFELSELIAEKINRRAKFEIMEMKQLFPTLNDKHVDMVTTIVKTNKRKEQFDFSKKYYTAKSYLIMNEKREDISNFGTAIKNNLVFGSVVGDIYNDFLSKFEPNIKLIRFDDLALVFEVFKNGSINAFLGEKILIEKFIENHKIKNYKIIQINMKEKIENGHTFMFKKGNDALRLQIDKAIDDLEKEGKIEELKKKYGLGVNLRVMS
jgi:ABC-type amino acid transport substrate-binding protein